MPTTYTDAFLRCLILTFTLLFQITLAQTSGSITQGTGTTVISDMLPSCPSNHITPLGTIQSTDGKTWDVPAPVNYYSASFLPDLYNTCSGVTPSNLASVNTNSLPVTVLDIAGDTITGFLFCDNYFELYINGVLIGVDPIPFTPFNSCMVKFKVSKPYTIAVKMVDWEEHLGIGSEIQATDSFHPGDAGFIAQFSDGTVTDSSWRVQSFYIAPLENPNDIVELPDGTHSSASATNTPLCGANCYGVHYEIDSTWTSPGFNDLIWPKATLYTAAAVTNQPAYVSFASTAWNNAQFIWSSNLILDNLVLARKTVSSGQTTISEENISTVEIDGYTTNGILIKCNEAIYDAQITLYDASGKLISTLQHRDLLPNTNTEIVLPDGLSSLQAIFIQIENADQAFTLHTIFPSK